MGNDKRKAFLKRNIERNRKNNSGLRDELIKSIERLRLELKYVSSCKIRGIEKDLEKIEKSITMFNQFDARVKDSLVKIEERIKKR